MSQIDRVGRLCVGDLRAVAATILERAGLITTGFDSIPRMGIQYLRMKPGRGLVVSFGALAPWPQSGVQLLTMMIGEDALEGTYARFGWTDVRTTPLETPSSRIVQAPRLSLSVQVFPVDAKLPALGACFDTSPDGPIFSSLEAAARVQLGEPKWTLGSVGVEPLRYKIGNRCVLAYRLRGTDHRTLAIIGKLYADRAQARFVHENLQRLYCQLDSGAGVVPRPLGVVDLLGLTYTEAIAPGEARTDSVVRKQQLDQPSSPCRPRIESVPTGGFAVHAPSRAVELAGVSLGRLHAIQLGVESESILPGPEEVEQLHKRVGRLVIWQPAQAGTISRLGDVLAARLEASAPDRYVMAHGSYKRTQVIADAERAYMIDFDSMCRADPALDVGSFLAYLRPVGLYYQRGGYREWFEVAAAQFVQGYRETVLSRDWGASSVDSTLERARLFEASRLFKIATRRINRLNSPRPTELMSICDEIADCLRNPGRWT